VNQHAAATALLQVALRRRLVSVKEALALRHVLAGCGADPQAIRGRLAHLPGQVSEATARALMELLPPADAVDPAPWKRLAHLGDGRLGSTWLGLGQVGLVVLKRFAAQRLDDDAAAALQNELAPLLGTGHRYLVGHLALFRGDDGCWTLVQHYRQGRDTSQRADIKGEASEARALTILRHCAKGLAQLHHLGLHHGHLHPGNVLLDGDGRAALGDHALCGPAHTPRWNATVLGRQAWAAPEELAERPVAGPAADIYALGCIGWWLLTGAPPFPGTADRQVLQHLGADRPDVREHAPGVSDLTAKTLLKCMHITPADRYADARALVQSLERNLDLLERPQHDTEPVAKPHDRGGPSPLLPLSLEGQSGSADSQ
jgi:serine/threonine-protein kinase